MVVQATTFETLRVLHNLWKSKDLDTSKVRIILQETYGLELTVLSNGYIKAETPDGNAKYSNK
jgi:hypothetical protein